MAHGKSLELQKIGPKPGSPLCICGKPWRVHMNKAETQRLKKYDNDDHYLVGQRGDKPYVKPGRS